METYADVFERKDSSTKMKGVCIAENEKDSYIEFLENFIAILMTAGSTIIEDESGEWWIKFKG